jgi:hypothetical protein
MTSAAPTDQRLGLTISVQYLRGIAAAMVI